MNFDEKRLRKDEKLMKKYYFLQEDFTVSGKQAQINFSLQGDYIEFKCKSRINPCTVISDNVDLQLKRGDVLLIQYPCGKKIHFGVHQSSTVECTKFGMLYTQEFSMSDEEEISTSPNSLEKQIEYSIIDLSNCVLEDKKEFIRSINEGDKFRFGEIGTKSLKLLTGREFVLGKTIFELSYKEQLGWFLIKDSISAGYTIEILVKDLPRFIRGEDSRSLIIKKGTSLRVGNHKLSLVN